MDSPQRSLALDGVRGLAVLIVFFSHSSGRELYPADFLHLQGIGHIGVYLFFVLSSWLLTTIVLREIETTGSVRLKSYFLRRAFRIIPLYFCVVIAVFAYQQATGSESRNYLHVGEGVAGLLKHLVLYKGDTVFWTIPCEVTFYLLLPFLALALAKWPKVAVSLLLAAAVGFSVWTVKLYYRKWSGPPFPKIVDIVHLSQFLEVFLIGVLGAWATWFFRDRIVWRPLIWRLLEVAIALALFSLLWYLCAITCEKFFWYERSNYRFRFQSALFAVVFAALIFVVEKYPEGYLAKFFRNRLLRLMGVLGFSWYLLHFPVFYFILEIKKRVGLSFAGADTLYFVLAWIACGLASWATFRLIEKPGISFGRRLEGNRQS
ncbi:MAG: acyltransferase [Verrucomicrobiae bacterium]|nr:acyltransferase [Verrucomicrobiae bacterium]